MYPVKSGLCYQLVDISPRNETENTCREANRSEYDICRSNLANKVVIHRVRSTEAYTFETRPIEIRLI